ncbi:MAG TPA: VWA domain-containing protein [Kofleriaceae bacterium]|nr:VWA domain-containing protein [Kofleriaceae bacterium]
MSSAPVSTARSHRRRTAAALVSAAATLAAVAFLTPRKAPRRVGPTSAVLSARLDSSHVLRGTTETYLAVSLTAPDGRVTQRPPASVAIVLDVSGSMINQPLEDAKAAAVTLIDQLGPADELAIVTFSTGSEVVFPLTAATEDARARAKARVAGLYAEGGTNIPAGLVDGADQLEASHAALRRVVLISDGKVETHDRPRVVPLASRRAAAGLSITAVGVGIDFDEELMAEIAVAGRGNYHFVEHARDLGAMFVSELGSLGETVLTRASLRVEPAAGVDLVDVIGYRFERDGRAVVVPVADQRRGERTKVVLRVRVTAGDEAVKELAEVRWTFDELGKGPRSATTIARAEVTADETTIARGRDQDTVRMIEKARTARALEEASAAYAGGRYDAAEAILRVRAAEAAAVAGGLGDDGLRQEIQDVTGRARRDFAAAPAAAAPEGRRAVKGHRADAYLLAR